MSQSPAAPKAKAKRSPILAKLFFGCASVALLIFALAAAAVLSVLRKPVDPRWEECGATEGVRSIAVDAKGHIHAASTGFGHGDVLSSQDQCKSFRPWGLRVETVWAVSYLPRSDLVCAGARDSLHCSDDPMTPRTGVTQDVYWAVETKAGVLTGGYPEIYLGRSDAKGFRSVRRGGFAAGDAAVSTAGVWVAANGLLLSRDGGNTFVSTGHTRRSAVVAAKGQRVFVAGGAFGGYLQRSDDGGSTFRSVEQPGIQPAILRLPFADPNIVLLGAHGDLRSGGLYLSRDGGMSWENLGCPVGEVHGVAVDNTHLYCGGGTLVTPKMGEQGMWRIPLAALGLPPPAG